MLAEGLPPAATTFSVASVPASIAATAERDNDASKRVLAFINETSMDRRELVFVNRGETRENGSLQHRIEYDIEYLENWSLGADIAIITQTAVQVVHPPKTAY